MAQDDHNTDISFISWLPSLSGVHGRRRRVGIIGCIVCMILAPMSVLMFMADANESHHAAIPIAMFFQVGFLFVIFGFAVWTLTTSFATIGVRDQRNATR
jgi:hypothetical protein